MSEHAFPQDSPTFMNGNEADTSAWEKVETARLRDYDTQDTPGRATIRALAAEVVALRGQLRVTNPENIATEGDRDLFMSIYAMLESHGTRDADGVTDWVLTRMREARE